jgi:hypothetical protein
MRKELLILAAIFILAGCGGGKNNNPQPASSPGKVSLSSPAQNQVCTTGTVITATTSSITFTWNKSDNTDSYDFTLKNLVSASVTTESTAATSITKTLARNTPYSWYITSRSGKTSSTAASDTWKFYNAGPGVVTYAPFPAEIIAPVYGQIVTTAIVNLTWKGSSVNPATIVNYDVYLGTTKTPAILKSAVTDSFVNGVAVTAKTTYYWKVITRDRDGNTSDSGLQQFTVN